MCPFSSCWKNIMTLGKMQWDCVHVVTENGRSFHTPTLFPFLTLFHHRLNAHYGPESGVTEVTVVMLVNTGDDETRSFGFQLTTEWALAWCVVFLWGRVDGAQLSTKRGRCMGNEGTDPRILNLRTRQDICGQLHVTDQAGQVSAGPEISYSCRESNRNSSVVQSVPQLLYRLNYPGCSVLAP